MTKTKSTKRALLMSVLSLLICVSMLIGSTFAWFTDSVTSAGNIIKSGTLDVTMEWADGTKAVPADDSTDWTDASTGAIFDYDLWEPGYVSVRHIKIANEGSLALKYQLNIIANGEVSKLADVIDVYYVDPAVQVADRTQLTDANKLGTLTEILANISTSASGNLKAGEKDTITLALKMRESAGNEYQDLAIGSDFSIQLLATQLTSEFDSFDDQYDADAAYPIIISDGLYYDGVNTYYVTNANGLTAVATKVNEVDQYAENIFDGKTVKLMSDIDLGGVEWSPIGNFGNSSNQFTGTFDGLGHTVSNFEITQKSDDAKNRSSYGLFGNVNGTIKNLTVANADVNLASGKFAAALVGRLNGGLIENCNVISSSVTINDWTVGGLVSQINAGDVIGCSVADTTVTGMAAVGALVGIRLSEGENTIEDCSVKNCSLVQNGSYGGNYDEMFGAILGAVNNGVAVVKVNNYNIESTKIKGIDSTVVCGYIKDGDVVRIDGAQNFIDYDATTMGVLYDLLPTLKSGDVLVLPAGTYNTSGSFIVAHDVTIKGADGAEVIFHQSSSAQDNIFNCEGDIVFENITFESNRKGYAITDTSKNHDTDGDITIINCKFKGIADEKNWGVYKNLNGNLTIKDCTFDNYNNAICGIDNSGNSTTVITGCTFTNINGEAIGYVSSTMPADFESGVIANNTGLTAENVIGY